MNKGLKTGSALLTFLTLATAGINAAQVCTITAQGSYGVMGNPRAMGTVRMVMTDTIDSGRTTATASANFTTIAGAPRTGRTYSGTGTLSGSPAVESLMISSSLRTTAYMTIRFTGADTVNVYIQDQDYYTDAPLTGTRVCNVK